MGRVRLLSSMALLLVTVLALGGCGKESTFPGGSPTAETPNLEEDLGGLTATNEAPAFGDPALAASASTEAPAEDAMAADPTIVRWAAGDSPRTFAATLLWGVLAEDPSRGATNIDTGETPATDWSGHLSVNRGGIVVRSSIAFEPGDFIVRPRTDRKLVEWVSHTTTSFDGIRVVIQQPLVDGQATEQDSLTIVAGTHVWHSLVNDLADMELTEDVDDQGDKFSIRSFLVEPGSCARGFLGGTWNLPVDPDSMGTFRGRWVSRDGLVTGFVRGHYGINEGGTRVLFGKYTDESGVFQGFLRGTWERVGREGGPQMSNHMRHFGTFRAEILDGERRPNGITRGQWRAIPGSGSGFFDGRWARGCPQTP
jgi:hypothetical protein